MSQKARIDLKFENDQLLTNLLLFVNGNQIIVIWLIVKSILMEHSKDSPYFFSR